jgi:hypothetical protein
MRKRRKNKLFVDFYKILLTYTVRTEMNDVEAKLAVVLQDDALAS